MKESGDVGASVVLASLKAAVEGHAHQEQGTPKCAKREADSFNKPEKKLRNRKENDGRSATKYSCRRRAAAKSESESTSEGRETAKKS